MDSSKVERGREPGTDQDQVGHVELGEASRISTRCFYAQILELAL